MITITEEIIINTDIQKVWGFLTDFEVSLNINNFHQEIILPSKFSFSNKKHDFNIIHNFGLGNVKMNIKVVSYKPLESIQLLKQTKHKPHKAFEHTSTYGLSGDNESTKLRYIVEGSFNFKIQNIPFKPILIKVMKNELLNMKSMIESSDIIPDNINPEITTP